MSSNTKSSITLPAKELKLVRELRARLDLKSNVDVVRAGLAMLREATDREELREAFRKASMATRRSLQDEIEELDHLAEEGLE